MSENWTIEEARPGDSAWGELLSRSPHLVFHTELWSRVLVDGFSPRLLCWLLRRDDQVRAGLLGVEIGAGPMRFGHLSVPYGGLIGDPVPPQTCARLLQEAARRRGLFRLRLIAGPQDRGGPDIAGAEGLPDTTHIKPLDFGDEEDLLMSYKKRVRRDVRRAARLGLEVAEVESEGAEVDNFYGLYLETMRRRQATPKYSLEYCQAILRHLGPVGQAALLSATFEGRMVGAMIVADSARASHYLFGAADYQHRSKQPSDLLIHHAMLRARRLGLELFDFLPSGDSAAGVADFKSKFGSEAWPLVNHTLVAGKVRDRLWRGLHASIDHIAVRSAIRLYRALR